MSKKNLPLESNERSVEAEELRKKWEAALNKRFRGASNSAPGEPLSEKGLTVFDLGLAPHSECSKPHDFDPR